MFGTHHEFFNVQLPDRLQVQVWDRDYLKPDDLLGSVELPVSSIVNWSQAGSRAWRDGWWLLKPSRRRAGRGSGAGRIEMKVRYRPYSSDPG